MIILKREKLKLIQSSIAECLSELVSKEKRLAYVQKLQEKNLELWRKATEQFSQKFEMTERKLGSLVGDVELKV